MKRYFVFALFLMGFLAILPEFNPANGQSGREERKGFSLYSENAGSPLH
ncbi:MAG: hypothetical protein LBS52_08635 [Dysgonamonadaceae bacterium]|jgi:hypothetical protein|nr:hypothetical protein [Dysgonamonadaceae bacterium]